MNLLGNEPPEQPSALRVENAATRPRRLRPAVWALLLTGAIAASTAVTLIGGAPAHSPEPLPTELQASPQPQITWSENQVEVILSPGETASHSLTLTSSIDLTNVAIEPVPEIAPFVTTKPSSISRLRANRSQKLEISVGIPTNAALGTYDGTIQVRGGTQTLPQTLKVVIRIWRAFQDADFGISFKLPPKMLALESSSADVDEIGFYEDSTTLAEGLGPVFVVALDVLPPGLSLFDWVRSFGVSESDMLEVDVGGRTFLRWREATGDTTGVISYSVLSPTGVLSFSSLSDNFASSDEFLTIIQSLEL